MQEPQPLWPYSERDATAAPTAVRELQAEPEIRLTEAEKAALGVLSHELFTGGAAPESLPPNLEALNQMPALAATKTFYTDYFRTEAGKEARRSLGLQHADDAAVRRELYHGVAYGEVPDSKVRREVAGDSREWYQKSLSNAVLRPADEDAAFEDSPSVQVNFNPDALLNKFELLQRYRSFYRVVRSGIEREHPDQLTMARHVSLDLHVARVNNMVAELYPSIVQLADQISQSPPSEKVQAWQARLFAAAPVVRRMFQEGREPRQTLLSDELLRRLDLVRNGAEAIGAPDFTPVATTTRELADELDALRGQEIPPQPSSNISPEMLEQMANTTWNAEQMREFHVAVLKELDLYSTQQNDWHEAGDESRLGPAADNKWQVIVTPMFTAHTTDGPKKILWVPEDFERTLSQVSPAGALLVASHELAHVLQNENDAILAQQIELAKVKGRRYITGREMGGIYEERVLHEMLGQIRPTNTTYLRALQAKLEGGNKVQAARAFLTASVGKEQISPKALRKKATTAGENILRLYRKGGNDSQPLDYLEQELLVDALSGLRKEQFRAISLSGGSFSLKDMAALHKIGLYDIPESVPYTPAETVLKVYKEQFANH